MVNVCHLWRTRGIFVVVVIQFDWYLDCWRWNAQIKFILLLHTRFNQLLDRVLFLNNKVDDDDSDSAARWSKNDVTYLKEKKRVAFGRKIWFTFRLVRPIDNKRSKAAETGIDFLYESQINKNKNNNSHQTTWYRCVQVIEANQYQKRTTEGSAVLLVLYSYIMENTFIDIGRKTANKNFPRIAFARFGTGGRNWAPGRYARRRCHTVRLRMDGQRRQIVTAIHSEAIYIMKSKEKKTKEEGERDGKRKRERKRTKYNVISFHWMVGKVLSIHHKALQFSVKENPTQFVYWSEGHE